MRAKLSGWTDQAQKRWRTCGLGLESGWCARTHRGAGGGKRRKRLLWRFCRDCCETHRQCVQRPKGRQVGTDMCHQRKRTVERHAGFDMRVTLRIFTYMNGRH